MADTTRVRNDQDLMTIAVGAFAIFLICGLLWIFGYAHPFAGFAITTGFVCAVSTFILFEHSLIAWGSRVAKKIRQDAYFYAAMVPIIIILVMLFSFRAEWR